MMDDIHDQMRGLTTRGVVVAVHDDGQVQMVDVQTHAGVIRQGVEVMTPYGLISHPPAEGSIVALLAMGGDQGDMVALPAGRPASRFAAFESEVGLCDAQGNRVHLRQGGVVEVHAAAKVAVIVGGVTFTIGDGRVSVAGADLVVDGDVSDRTGSMRTMRGQYNAHANPAQGAAPPDPQMT